MKDEPGGEVPLLIYDALVLEMPDPRFPRPALPSAARGRVKAKSPEEAARAIKRVAAGRKK